MMITASALCRQQMKKIQERTEKGRYGKERQGNDRKIDHQTKGSNSRATETNKEDKMK